MRKIFNTEIVENFMKENNLSINKFSKMCGITVLKLKRFLAHNGKGIKSQHLNKIAILVKVNSFDLIYDRNLKILSFLIEYCD